MRAIEQDGEMTIRMSNDEANRLFRAINQITNHIDRVEQKPVPEGELLSALMFALANSHRG